MFKTLVIITTLFIFATARAETTLSCESTGSWKMLPQGDDKLLDVDLAAEFMSLAGDAGIWSHFNLKSTTADTLVFESAIPTSTWQTKDITATVDRTLLNEKPKGTIVFKSKTSNALFKSYKCE